MEGFVKAMMVIMALFMVVCCFGFVGAVKQSGIRIDRCQEIRGIPVSGMYNDNLCRVNGTIVDVDYDDYLQQAENARADQ